MTVPPESAPQVIPEGAGRCHPWRSGPVSRGVLCPFFPVSAPWPGMPKRARGLLCLDPGCGLFLVAAIWGERTAPGQGPGGAPAAAAAPQASLRRSSAISDTGAAGTGGGVRLCSGPTVQPCQWQAPGCGHPFEVPAACWPRGAWGGPRAGSGINQRRGRAARGRGPDLRAITRCPCPGLLTRPVPRGCGRPGT
jgi:hypothetical protein